MALTLYGTAWMLIGMAAGYYMAVMNRREAARCWAECKRAKGAT